MKAPPPPSKPPRGDTGGRGESGRGGKLESNVRDASAAAASSTGLEPSRMADAVATAVTRKRSITPLWNKTSWCLDILRKTSSQCGNWWSMI